MKIKMNQFICAGGAAAVLLGICGCSMFNTPFAPVAVPKGTAIRPAKVKKVDEAKLRKELMQLQKVKVPEYKIRPGDTVAITIPEREDLSRPGAIVMSDGAIIVSPIGRVIIGGLTFQQASAKLTKLYRKYIEDCEIVLEPMSIQQAQVFVTGAIGKGGSAIPIIVGQTRLRDVLAQAGGLTSTEKQDSLADLKHAVIVRDSKVLPVDFSRLMKNNDLLHNIPVLDGDYIDIPSLADARIIMLGETGSSALIYQPGMTLLEAIAKSGGLKITNSRTIKVIRGGLKDPEVYTVDVYAMQVGKIQDMPLEPKDIVFVPRNPISEWNAIIQQVMPTIQLINGAAGPFGNPGSFIYQNVYNKD